MKNLIKILHLEDLPSDAELVERALKKGGIVFEKIIVDNRKDFEQALKEFSPDIILSDHSLPSFTSIQALQILKEFGKIIPFILITATVSEEFAVNVMQLGADDYILKDKMGRLPSAVVKVIDKYEAQEAKLKAEHKLLVAHERLLFHLENSPLGYIEWDNKLKVKSWSPRAQQIFGWSMDEFNDDVARKENNHVHPEDQQMVLKISKDLLNGVIERDNTQNRNYTKDGKVIWCEWFNSALKNKEGKVVTIMSLVQDITERKEAEQALINNELRFREFFETAPEALLVINPDALVFEDYNDNALKLLQCTGEELLEKSMENISPPIQQDGRKSAEKIKDFISLTKQGERPIFDWIIRDAKGKNIFCEVRLNVITNDGHSMIRASVIDITQRILLERKLVEEKIKRQKEITEAVLSAQEQERSFLGEELHDNINQILATSKLYLDLTITSVVERKDLIIDSRNYIMNAMEEIRKLSKSLQSPSLGEKSLLNAITEMIENIENVNTMQFKKEWNGIDEWTLSEKIKINIFRIVQEQLNNIFKYAHASNVLISLKQNKGVLQLIVKDDGVGFDTSAKRLGIGLKNILSRASVFNGEVIINSSPGAGCELVVKLSTEITEE